MAGRRGIVSCDWRGAAAVSFLLFTLSSICVDGFLLTKQRVGFSFQTRVRSSIDDSVNISPRESLHRGSWFKFISGASNQDIPLVRNLCYIYTLAGVDCIDISADPAVVNAARDGINDALREKININDGKSQNPYLMISVNDDEDPHFRKAHFNPAICPADCTRPCEKVCPALAIPALQSSQSIDTGLSNEGVIQSRCYGCGRCVPICPLGLITTESYTVSRATIRELFHTGAVEAIEIHTLANHEKAFADLWGEIGHEVLSRAKVLAVSFPDMGADTLPYLNKLQQIIQTHPSWGLFEGVQIWQADGRPMSGDIGKGTTHKTSNLAAYVLREIERVTSASTSTYSRSPDTSSLTSSVISRESSDIPNNTDADDIVNLIDVSSGRHFIQLAGGTNNYSGEVARREKLIGTTGFGGFAFGGYARKEIGAYIHSLEEAFPGARVEDHREVFEKCLNFAKDLVRTVKQ